MFVKLLGEGQCRVDREAERSLDDRERDEPPPVVHSLWASAALVP
jgi:hypothetical protein